MTKTLSVRRSFLLALACSGALFVLAVSSGHAVDLSVAARPGVLPDHWTSGAPDCSRRPPPSFQIHAYNSDFYILRESGCVHSEKPFLYLLFGNTSAILFDTGAGGEDGALVEPPPVSSTVHVVMRLWALRHRRPVPKLIVGHLHSHGDHTYGDPQFAGAPNTTFIPPGDVSALQAAYAIANWPTDIGSIDLGARVLDIVPIPGHDDTSIAVYDRETGVLLTGDTMYPGRIYINSEADVFAASIARVIDFTKDKVVAHVLGTHIEQKAPYTDYPVGTKYAPVEMPLGMSRGNLLEMLEATTFRDVDGKIQQRAYRDFSVCGSYPNCAAVNL